MSNTEQIPYKLDAITYSSFVVQQAALRPFGGPSAGSSWYLTFLSRPLDYDSMLRSHR